MKRILCVCLALFAVALFAVTASAETTGIESLAVNPYGNELSAGDTITWRLLSKKWFLFLPADVDAAAAKVYFTASDAVTVDGEALTSGESAGKLAEAGSHTVQCGEQSYPVVVMQSANIPAVYINLESHTLSWLQETKEHKDKAAIRIYEDGALTLDGALTQIKGRGNSTWQNPKKPYNIKFDKKTDLFGMGKAKKWSLLASFHENSLLRNPTAFTMAEMLGLHYTSQYRHVDLYINNEYQGNYILCESVEVGGNRVEINDLDSANEDANPDVDLESLPTVGTGANTSTSS